MKKRNLSALMVLLAAAGFFLRRMVYLVAVDEKNLIMDGHPAQTGLWVLTAAAMALAAFGAWKQKEREPGPAAFFGHGMLGVGLLLAVLGNSLPMPGLLGNLWKVLGLVSPVCLLTAGFLRMRGKTPFFGLYAVPCLFFVVSVVAHYQIWCSNPQFTDYAFALLACVMLALHSYQLAAASLDEGDKRMLVFTGLAAVFLCGAEMAQSLYPALYLGGALFCLTDTNA